MVAMFANGSVLNTILVFDWLISKKYSPLSPLGQMNQNLVGNILRRSSIKIAHLVPSGFRGEDFLEINQSQTRIVCGGQVCKQIGTK
jgi:hypothetical protein